MALRRIDNLPEQEEKNMNETIRTILSRRSVREYSDKPIPEDLLDQILSCAQAAPSGMNRQACQFTVLSGKALSGLLRAVRVDALHSPDSFWRNAAAADDFNFFYNAPVFIIASADPARDPLTPIEDGAIALENMMIAAASLGVSSCWIHSLVMINPLREGRAYLDSLGLPVNHRIIGSISLGYASGEIPERPPLEGNRIVEAS